MSGPILTNPLLIALVRIQSGHKNERRFHPLQIIWLRGERRTRTYALEMLELRCESDPKAAGRSCGTHPDLGADRAEDAAVWVCGVGARLGI